MVTISRPLSENSLTHIETGDSLRLRFSFRMVRRLCDQSARNRYDSSPRKPASSPNNLQQRHHPDKTSTPWPNSKSPSPHGKLPTNRPVASWGEIFSDSTIAAAMLDRLLHKSVVFTITGDSYRLRTYQAQARKHRPKGDPLA